MLTSTTPPSYPNDPLPAWVKELRPHQVDAVNAIVEAYDDGAEVVFLDAPVGSGKTLIAELVRRELSVKPGLYVCSDKALQQQFLDDYDYARVLMGRANYPTLKGRRPAITADDCTMNGPGTLCMFCDPTEDCPYTRAKRRALVAKVAVLNTSYALHMHNYVQKDNFRSYQFVVEDECDLLEGALVGFVEYEVPSWIDRALKLDMPKRAVHKPTLIGWLRDYADELDGYLKANGGRLEPKKERAIERFQVETVDVMTWLEKDVHRSRMHEDDDSAHEDAGRWIRDYDTETFKMRPVTVQQFGAKYLWRHGKRWLLMSGTVVSADEMADSLGLPLDWRVIEVESTFPVENRPVIMAPVATVTRAAGEAEWPKLAYAIEQIARHHEGRILVHTVSYALTNYLRNHVSSGPNHPKIAHNSAYEKRAALEEYLYRPGAMLFSPSSSRGLDLAYDKCSVQIIVKCPYPSLGDKQIQARVHLPGGQGWYSVKTIRDLVQMTGRGVRSETDQCTTYILDAMFPKLWTRNKGLFPRYFRDAVQERYDIRWLMQRR